MTDSDADRLVHPRTAAFLARVRAVEERSGGRLPLPDIAEWDVFPFEGDLQVKRIEDPVLPEPPRNGEGGRACGSCADGLAGAVWADDDWKLVPGSPMAFPGALLCPIRRLDQEDLDERMARDLGWLQVRVGRALRSLGGVGRVQLYKIGDGGAHLHWWFFARPEGMLQLRGSALPDWEDCLPKIPQADWDELMTAVATELATGGGQVLPR